MLKEQFLYKNQKELRMGYTTGSCAAAAAKAAVYMLLTGEPYLHVTLMTPKGIPLYLDVEHIRMEEGSVSCGIQKDSGDDPDVTNGVYVYASVRKTDEPGIMLDGGTGIGRVTKKGLEQEIGQPAINKVPRDMIQREAKALCEKFDYRKGLSIIISIPEGVALAKKTFNPRLGITGGLSVLGTTGIVEPMSEKALTDTIFLEMKVLRESGQKYCFVVPGNYGTDFLRERLGFEEQKAVKCSNYVGETIDHAIRLHMKGLLFAAHIGKFVKVAAGVMNTHSRQADCRMEVFAAHAAMAGAWPKLCIQIMECVTTTEAVDLLQAEGLLEVTMSSIMDRIGFYLDHRSGETLQTGAIVFSNEHDILGETDNAQQLLKEI